tara:strand:+ start:2373 stop:3278 length:906 start_codon:yes stop_codon:yes gene_type:complete
MNNEENTQGNPEAVDNAVLGSESEDFFSALEDSVNSIVQEPEQPEMKTEATSGNQSPNQTVTNKAAVSQGSEDIELDNLKKRYSDSSREAQNLRAQLNELKPFVPVLDAMKKDNGLVNHVRDYFESGGDVNPDFKKQLKLDDDFQFDPDEMISNPDSDSRKVFDKMIGSMVDKKANEIMSSQQQQNKKAAYKGQVQKQATEFMEKHAMTQDEFKAFTNEARAQIQQRGITFEDMYLMINKGEVSKNVANSTKNDMLNQMRNVRDIPTSVGGANNAGKSNNQNDGVFDALLNSDGNIEELLG